MTSSHLTIQYEKQHSFEILFLINQIAAASLFRTRKTRDNLHLRKVPILHIVFLEFFVGK